MQKLLYGMPVKRDYVRMTQRKRLNRDYEIIVQVANDLFMSKIVDAIEALKQSSLYKHEMKQAVNNLQKEVNSYSRFFNGKLVSPASFADLAGNIEDYISNDMSLLKIAIKQALDNRQTKIADLYTVIEFATCIGCMATAITDNVARNYCYTAERLKPFAVMKALGRVVEIIRAKLGDGVDLRVDKDIEMFIGKLAVLMCDSRVYFDAMEEAEK